jgi:hypothetical protein
MKANDLNALYQPVEKVLMEELLPEFQHLSGQKHAMVLTLPNGKKEIVNYCSDDYYLVQNKDIIPAFIEEISKFFKVETSIKVRNDTRFYVDFHLKQKEFTMFKGDIIYPAIRYVNSIDGSVKYHWEMLFWRQICSNGLKGFVNWDSVKNMHTPGLENITDFTKVMEMTSLFLAEADEHFENYRFLQSQNVKKPALRIEEVLDETDFPKSLEEDVLYRLETESQQLGISQITDWLVYNAFNYQLNHAEEYKAREEKKAKIDAQVFQYLLNY